MVDGNSVLTSQPAGSRQGYGRGHGPFALKGPLENLRGREGAVKESINIKRGR